MATRRLYIKEVKKRIKEKNQTLLKRAVEEILEGEGHNRKAGEMVRLILALAAGGLLVSSFVIAPGLAYGIRPFVNSLKHSKNPYIRNISKYKQLKRLIERMHKKKYIKFIKKHRKIIGIKTTEFGDAKLFAFAYQMVKIPQPSKWDRIWRLVIFDIPESRKLARDALRWKLKQLGFYQLQKSVFVSPHPCEEEINFICDIFHVWHYVTFIQTKSLGRQEPDTLRYFGMLE